MKKDDVKRELVKWLLETPIRSEAVVGSDNQIDCHALVDMCENLGMKHGIKRIDDWSGGWLANFLLSVDGKVLRVVIADMGEGVAKIYGAEWSAAVDYDVSGMVVGKRAFDGTVQGEAVKALAKRMFIDVPMKIIFYGAEHENIRV